MAENDVDRNIELFAEVVATEKGADSVTSTVVNSTPPKAISSPFSTGSGGGNFENKVQTFFVIMMLSGGYAPCLPPWPIVRVGLQRRYAEYSTDDLIVYVSERNGSREAKLLAQVKHGIAITENDAKFAETIAAAWADFNNASIFDSVFDQLALISEPLSATDTKHARTILEWAHACETSEEFFNKVNLAKFSSAEKKAKLQAFRTQLRNVNNGMDVGDDVLFQFLKRFHILGFDLDSASSTTLTVIHSLLSVFRPEESTELFGAIAQKVAWFNENAGTITIDDLPVEIREVFVPPTRVTIPEGFVRQSNPDELKGDAAEAIVFATLLGGWNENVAGDNEIIRELVDKK